MLQIVKYIIKFLLSHAMINKFIIFSILICDKSCLNLLFNDIIMSN